MLLFSGEIEHAAEIKEQTCTKPCVVIVKRYVSQKTKSTSGNYGVAIKESEGN